MKVFLDTEFYEFQPSAFRTRWVDGVVPEDHGPSTSLERVPGANAVALISIGAVREDGAEFYAENADFDWGFVPEDHWLQENVRPHLWHGNGKPMWMIEHEQGPIPKGGRYEPSDIAQAFLKFATAEFEVEEGITRGSRPEFWGYFCDYDWVVLCGLYGRMVDLPPEFPKYCLDLKQEMHRHGTRRADLPVQQDGHHHALADARWIREAHRWIPVPGEDFA